MVDASWRCASSTSSSLSACLQGGGQARRMRVLWQGKGEAALLQDDASSADTRDFDQRSGLCAACTCTIACRAALPHSVLQREAAHHVCACCFELCQRRLLPFQSTIDLGLQARGGIGL